MNPPLVGMPQTVWSGVVHDVATAQLNTKTRMLEAEVVEPLRYGCVTWTLSETLRQAPTGHHQVLLRAIAFSAPTTYGPQHPLARQGPQDDMVQQNKNERPQTVALCEGVGVAKQGSVPQSGDDRDDVRGGGCRIRSTTDEIKTMSRGQPPSVCSHRGTPKHFPFAFGVESVTLATAANIGGIWKGLSMQPNGSWTGRTRGSRR